MQKKAMQKTAKPLAALVLAFCWVGAAQAHEHQERQPHFQGKPSPTLNAAVKNFSDYNKRLADVLAKDKLSERDMVRVHEFSYTLEIALQKINSEFKQLEETLENMHIASEEQDAAAVQREGRKYLQTAREVVK